MRWASYYPPIIDRPLPGADQEPDVAEQTDADFYARRAAARLATARIEGAEADIADAPCASLRGNATALSLSALLALARADRDSGTRASGRGPGRRAAVGRRAGGAVARRAELRRHCDAAERALREALAIEPDNAIALTRLAEIALARRTMRAPQSRTPARARSSGPDAKRPARRARLRQPAGVRHGRRRETRSAAASSSSPTRRCRGSGLALASIQRGDELARAAPARARRRPRSGQPVDAQLHGQASTTPRTAAT